MKASLRVAALVVTALALTNAVHAGIVNTIDFDEIGAGGTAVPTEYANDTHVSADFRVENGAGVLLNRMKVWDETAFNLPGTGGVAMDTTDNAENMTYWGEITLTVNDPVMDDIALNSFLLGRRPWWDRDEPPPNTKLVVDIYTDGVMQQLLYWNLTEGGSEDVVQVTPDEIFADMIVIRWTFPYNIGVDDIDYSLSTVPEPATVVTWVLGLAGLGFVSYRRKRSGS